MPRHPFLEFVVLVALCVAVPVSAQTQETIQLPSVNITEGLRADVTILDIGSDYPSADRIFHQINNNNRDPFNYYFNFPPDEGTIVTSRTVSRDDIAARLGRNFINLPVTLDVSFSVIIGNDHIIIVNVDVNILDLDNHSPVFTDHVTSPLFMNLTENAGVGLDRKLPRAEDNDEGINSTTIYLLRNSINDLFFLNIERGVNGFVNKVYLVLNGSLDRETRDNYVLYIDASEGNSNPDTATLIVNITVLDICDESPEFPVTRYSSSIEENQPAHSVIPGNFTATDLDLDDTITYQIHQNGVCSYQYEDVDPCRDVPDSEVPFQLDRETGELTITQELDRERFAQYEVTIHATDSCGRPDSATVVVTVLNVNDNAPNVNSSTTPNVTEGIAEGFQIYFLHINDPDYGQSSSNELRFTFNLYDNSTGIPQETDLFHLQETELILSQSLDREVTDHYSLVLNVTDWGTPNRSTLYPLPINVVDINDNSPMFNRVDELHVVENTSLPTPIVTVHAEDLDSYEAGNGRVSYRLPLNNSFPYQGLFSIDDMGRLMLNGTLDREETGSISVLVEAVDNPTNTDTSGAPRSDFVVVNLLITDINDNAPEIHTPPETLQKDETIPVNSIIFSVYATDGDFSPNFRRLRYSMTSTSDLPFQLNSTTGNVTLISALDYDRGQTSYSFTVGASDENHVTTRQVVLNVQDVNDERCVFNRNGPYVFSVNESSPHNYLIGNVGGSDLDTRSDQLTFDIMSGNVGGDLRIDSATGEIFTTTSLDHDMVSNYTLTVSCSDGPDLFSETTVLIQVFDINDNTPQFVGAPYNFTITEGNNVNDLVGTVHADDGDSMGNGMISYRIASVDPEGARDWFVIHSTSGEIRAARSLDREADELSGLSRDIVTISVLATDNPSNSGDALSNATSVVVEIRDFNDEPPRFNMRSINISIPENYQVGLEFDTRIQANDKDIAPNNMIRYRLHGDTPISTQALFRIDETTGEISLAATLDFESVPMHIFVVVADDPNQPNFNDEQTVNILVMNVGETNVTFADFMTDVNLPENTMINQTVSTFTVTDINDTPLLANLPQLVYFVRNRNGSIPNDFDIRNDTSNSRLIVYVSGTIDREALDEGNGNTVKRVLNITAMDPDTTENSHGSASAILRVTILDINDNHPTFEPSSYTFDIVENNGEGVSLGRVTATDPDFGVNGTSGISYQISDSVPFEIESNGNIRVTEELDREFRSFYDFSVVASDGGSPPMTAMASVRINVADENDNYPMFVNGHNVTIHVREDAEVYSIVAHLNVRDLDDGHFGEFNITMGDIASSYFRLETNGSIVLTGLLDRETRDRHFFTALARDGGNQVTQGDITIIVDDVNDNRPIFHGVTTSISIPENMPPGVSFDGRVTATDRDIGRNGDVRYALGSIEYEKTFCINATEGNISLCRQLDCTGGRPVADYERDREYLITIIAYDLGEPRFITSQDIRIVVTPVNEHPPTFDKNFLVVHIDETDTSDVEVVAIHAIDRDRDDTISYEVLENGRTSSLFRYDFQRRAIVTNGIINFDLAPTHELELVARDSSDPNNVMTGTTVVMVFVNNINNNDPVFDNGISIPDINYPLVIPESTTVGSLVWTVQATDADNSSFAAVSYYLVGNNPALPFTIDSTTGEIFTNESLDYEVTTSYALRVVARDTGNRESSPITVTVNIKNENDHDPVFTSSLYNFTINENTPANYRVGQVQAPDRDSGSYNQVRYCFTSGVNTNFQIDPVSGTITSLVEFDRDEGVAQYELTVGATDRGLCSSAARASARVLVTIVDENDNGPVFGESEYLVRISPTQQPSVTLETLSVTDADDGPYAQFSYSITPAEPGNLPLIISLRGELSLNTSIPTSYKPSYSYTVRATDQADRGLHSSVRLEIIIETPTDHHPTFRPIPSIEVPESTSIGSPLFNVANYVTDIDSGRNGNLTFELADMSPKFTIDRNSGVVSLREMVDYEGTREYNIHVKAMDDRADIRRTATAAVTVTVLPSNEHAPVFMGVPPQLTLSYLPHTNLDLLTIMADDDDQGEDGMVRYDLAAQFELDDVINSFSIDMQRGILRNRILIERDTSFRLIIGAYDLGNPLRTSNTTILINIQAPDSAPEFLTSGPRVIMHDETNFTREVIAAPFVTNPRATSLHIVQQTISGQSAPIEAFEIDAEGQLRNIVLLDYERTREYSLIIESRIEVTSAGQLLRQSDFLVVTLRVTDVNDNAPFFSLEDQTFNESTPVNTHLFTVRAIDNDDGQAGTVSYSISGGNDDQTFRINATSGEVFLNQPLDRERTSSYNLVIRARDRSTHPLSFEKTVHITITDINDFETTFNGRNYTVGVHEFPYTHPRQRIAKISATDRDEGARLIYEMVLVTATHLHESPSLSPTILRSTFVMNPDTGVVSVGDQSILDRESVDFFLYRVTARDQTFEAVTYLTIHILDVNDNSPSVVVSSERTNILEDQPAGLLVPLTLEATDLDSGVNGYLRYSLGSDWPPENYFEIHPLTGIIRTTRPVMVSAAVQLFGGTIIVTDHGEVPRQTSLTASIRVTDVNNHPPVFDDGNSVTISVTQHAGPSSRPIHIFSITDPDFSIHMHPEFRIPSYYSEANSNFNIGFGSGQLTLIRSQPHLKTYNFEIQVFNRNFEPECSEFHQGSSISVTINVRPENTGCPEFTQQSYSINFTEGASNEANSLIRANDPDGDMVTYSIISPLQVPFSLNSETGVLSADIILDREDRNMYSLTVQATDDGFPARSCSVSVTVNVLDINDNDPEFERNVYLQNVKENLPVDSWINLTVGATDDDLVSEGRIEYELAANNVPFRVDRNSGRVLVNDNLDFESTRQYTFSVIALDNADPPRSSTAEVTVMLEDVNEFSPVFDSRPTRPISVNDNPIITLAASDSDAGAQLTYYFGQPDPSSYLSINNRTGEISLRQSGSESCPDTLPQQLPDDPEFFLINSTVSVTDGENTDSIPVSFRLHNSFCTIALSPSLPIEIIAASITAFLFVVLVLVCIVVFACICHAGRHSKVKINDRSPSVELQKRFGSTRSSAANTPAPTYRQTSLGPGSLPHEHNTMNINHSIGGSGASSTRQSYGDLDEQKEIYPSPGVISRKSQLSKPYRSTSDLGSSTVATDMALSGDSQETAPYPKAQIEKIYAKNADLLNHSDSNESIHMFGSEGGGESDGGDDMLFRKFDDLDDDDDTTTMPDEDDRSYQRSTSRDDISIPPIMDDPYAFEHSSGMWAPRMNTMAETIEQMAITSYDNAEDHMRHGGGGGPPPPHYMNEFSKSQEGMGMYGGASTQESVRPLLRHAHPPHPQSRIPPQHMMQPAPEYYPSYADVPGDVRLQHDHQPRVPKYAPAPAGLPMYPHDLPPPTRGHSMAARHGGGGASQEAYGYHHGDYMHHHGMHHEMGGDHSPSSSSTPTEETLNTRALTNEYEESDLTYSSDDTSLNTRTESQQEHHHPHLVGGYSQSGGHNQRHGYH